MNEHLLRVLNMPQTYLADCMLTTLGRFAVLGSKSRNMPEQRVRTRLNLFVDERLL